MEHNYVKTSDGLNLFYKKSGNGKTALFFVHGWLGNAEWWNKQQAYFDKCYTVVSLDLPGHGKSDVNRGEWTSNAYAMDIKTVAEQLDVDQIVLIGHSMSGAYVLEAALYMSNVCGVVLVDTLKDIEKQMTLIQAEEMLFSKYRSDFNNAVDNLLPNFLFCNQTPQVLIEQLKGEFLSHPSDLAIKVIEPLYKMNIKAIVSEVNIPVRGINSDFSPTNIENNLNYFKDYDYKSIHQTGHYPMLEKPDEFNTVLSEILDILLGKKN